MAIHIKREVTELLKNLEARSLRGDVIPVQEEGNNIFDISVMNVMWMILRGERYEPDDPKIINLMETIHKSFQIVDMSGGILNFFPFVRYFLPDKSGFRPLVETLKPLWSFLKFNISQVLTSFDPKCDPRNFIEFYCREIFAKSSQASFFTSEQLLALCVDFFQAGSETTSNTLAFAMLYMIHYPDVCRKVQNELDSVLGDRLPEISDRPLLNYALATICEIQRMANVAPLGGFSCLEFDTENKDSFSGIAHRALRNLNVGSYIIPKDAVVLFNIYSVHMDPNCWNKPEEFIPERFLNENQELITYDSFIPFGKLNNQLTNDDDL